MLRTILVPLDGSPLAEKALGPACRLAAQTGAALALVRAANAPAPAAHAGRSPYHEAEDYLDSVARRLADAGYWVRTEALRADAAYAIAFSARMQAADLIVMSTHGRSGLQRLLLGSVAQDVLRRTTLPVLLVQVGQGSEKGSETGRAGAYRAVLVPLDGSAESEAALGFLTAAGLDRSPDLVLVRAVPPLRPDWTSGRTGNVEPNWEAGPARRRHEAAVAAAQQYLQGAAERWLPGSTPRLEVLEGDIAETLPALAGAEGVELIVMATHGRSGLDRFLHGSVTAQVLQGSPVPVLLVHAATAQPETGEATTTDVLVGS